MIIYHQNNLSAFAGNHIVLWVGQPLHFRISKTSAAPAISILDFERGFGRGIARGYSVGMG